MITKPPVFVKESILKEIEQHVDSRLKEGYQVKAKAMFFTPIHGTRPKEVKILVSAIKFEDNMPVRLSILRGDGTWR